MSQENYLDFLLHRIIQGRLRVAVDGLVFFIHEPKSDIIFESYEVYQKVYDEAYMSEVFIESELNSILLSNDIWNPILEKRLEQYREQLDNLKVEAYQNFFKARELRNLKSQIFNISGKISDLLSKKHMFDQNTCHGVAEQARWEWILQNSIFYKTGKRVKGIDINKLSNIYRENLIESSDIRKLARFYNWRTMWVSGKKCNGVFSCPSHDLTRDQLTLCSFSNMYDGVYEHPECPDEKIIEDDDCLDGWFIFNRRKSQQDKTQKDAQKSITNSKIQNAKEQFIMADSEETAKAIFNLNDPLTKQIVTERSKTIDSKGTVKDMDFSDVKQEINLAQNNMLVNKIRGR